MRALRAAESELTTRTLAFVVMPDHLHWLFILQHGSLPTVVGQMKGRAARYASSALSVAIDWVATTASSQPPLMPRSRLGLSCLTVSTVKMV